MHRTANETCSEVGCTSGCQSCELVQSPSENDSQYYGFLHGVEKSIYQI
ncbi:MULTISPECIES: hypothetical protein [unclassified Photorhabdus]|nr:MULTISPECIES: hypothetical protein [unclassified Photorhabdus]